MPINRREFVKASVVADATPAVPAVHAASKTGETYRTALVGSGWWGTNILREAIGSGGYQVISLCDVDRNQVEICREEVGKLSTDTAKLYTDFRELLDLEKPEIVIVATPNHWHPLIVIAAMKAGAHVYVEKPISHTLSEDRAMVAKVGRW